MLWLVLLVITCLVLAYVMLVRPLIVNAPLLSPVFAREASFSTKVRVWLLGWKTKLAARAVSLGGIVVGLYDYVLPFATGQDWTPVTKYLPDWSLPVGLMAMGVLFAWLRHVTENPPQVITQKTEEGEVHVVAVVPPAPAAA